VKGRAKGTSRASSDGHQGSGVLKKVSKKNARFALKVRGQDALNHTGSVTGKRREVVPGVESNITKGRIQLLRAGGGRYHRLA